ncbi:TetR/AcrR family transcriptional regulator [Neobacillus niacini]|uniref:TetR/AcrR family transcriptional regulator n=1 Tax=Neobacillus niacini TaxID=86668 RepID=UPI0021CB3845|nr:TetR/AcrR family transcriptional regulator [Neobacillus niacini]MCM3767135.1 TetR/AcrR family transcriptional regulator [Neobacillus niacini]
MDTRSKIIDIATALFQQKGYKSVGVTEILKECKISKGSLYHHFPNGKEEILIACLKSVSESIITIVKNVYKEYPTTLVATQAMIEKMVADFERDGTIAGNTITSIVSEMGTLSESVRIVCADLYTRIQEILAKKLVSDGFSEAEAHSIALTMTTSFEGGIMLCLTYQSSDPLKTISHVLPKLLN